MIKGTKYYGMVRGKSSVNHRRGSGIGRALVERLLEEGAQVGVLERSNEKVKELQEQFGEQVVVVQGDVTLLEDNERAVAETDL
jgi:NAD(P)-dependent dehydrogenase (short-subunit alcohol dehydrogenase family)